MQESIIRLTISTLLLCFGLTGFGQVYEVSYKVKENKKKQVVSVFMKSAADTAVRIRAVNFSIVYDSTCSEVKKYECVFSELWTTFIERGGSVPVKDSLIYDDILYNKRWIFGTGQMPNTENVILPPQSEKPVRVLTVTFAKSCKKAPLYLEEESEFRVNQMGDKDNKAVPWLMIR